MCNFATSFPLGFLFNGFRKIQRVGVKGVNMEVFNNKSH